MEKVKIYEDQSKFDVMKEDTRIDNKVVGGKHPGRIYYYSYY